MQAHGTHSNYCKQGRCQFRAPAAAPAPTLPLPLPWPCLASRWLESASSASSAGGLPARPRALLSRLWPCLPPAATAPVSRRSCCLPAAATRSGERATAQRSVGRVINQDRLGCCNSTSVCLPPSSTAAAASPGKPDSPARRGSFLTPDCLRPAGAPAAPWLLPSPWLPCWSSCCKPPAGGSPASAAAASRCRLAAGAAALQCRRHVSGTAVVLVALQCARASTAPAQPDMLPPPC